MSEVSINAQIMLCRARVENTKVLGTFVMLVRRSVRRVAEEGKNKVSVSLTLHFLHTAEATHNRVGTTAGIARSHLGCSGAQGE